MQIPKSILGHYHARFKFWSRAAQALAPRVDICLEIGF
jgi:hypothetical protein